jgi:hypothetical protein
MGRRSWPEVAFCSAGVIGSTNLLGWYKLKAMRYAILLGLCALTLLESQTIDPNKTGFPHDMIWFNEPKNPQPGVTHHGYHSASMN